VLGTIIAFLVVAPLTYIANSLELFTLTFEDGKTINLSVKEVLLFASVISATDTVAALTFVKEETEPKLFAILFGEGVVNDAVCIVLYRIIKVFSESNEGI
jgi:NhaP-type Na+/H+ or K+/H+ antiporter